MQTIEYTFVDKTAWGDGPWQHECDKRQWQDPATGLPCLLRRHAHHGHLCGYVGVPPGHPLHGAGPGDADLDAYGGVNYAAACMDGEPEHGICHRPDAGEPDHVWWFGFACDLACDLAPGMEARMRAYGGPTMADLVGVGYACAYRDVAYVVAECADLAKQLAARS